jgi:hypothetical protein
MLPQRENMKLSVPLFDVGRYRAFAISREVALVADLAVTRIFGDFLPVFMPLHSPL